MLVHTVGLYEDNFFMNDSLQASSEDAILEEPLVQPSRVQPANTNP